MLESTEDIKNITFSSYATSPNDNFSGKMWFGLFFFLRRLPRAAAAGLQPAPVHQSALCLRRWSWSELTVFGKHFAYFCLFWHLLRARSAEGRPHVCVCGGGKTDGIDIRAVLFFHHQYSNPMFQNCKNMCETPIRYPRSHLYLMDSNLQVLAIESASLHFCNLWRKQLWVSSQDAKLMRGFVSVAARR